METKEKWRAKDGSIVAIDSLAFNGRLKIGSVYKNPKSPEEGIRCIWDSKSGQAWGQDGWDLEEKLEDATTSS